MEALLAKIRLLGLAVIAGSLLVLGSPEPASGWYCQFCVNSCPADLEEYCSQQGCFEGSQSCDPVAPYYCPGGWQVNCSLI